VPIARASKRKIQKAAAMTGRTVTDFVMQTALVEAEIVLSSRTQFSLSGGQWERFLAAVDAPPRPMPRLRCLLRETSVAERAD
jgi:uncharacterized protein (DUF1778 family)